MTVEMAAFYRRILSVGLTDTYQRGIGLALEKEDPLPEPLLDLAFCLSDINKTISILNGFIDDCSSDEFRIYPMILSEMRALYRSGRLKLAEIAEKLFGVLESAGLQCEEPWKDLVYLSYEYDEVKEGSIYLDDFLVSFAEYLFA